MSYSTENIVRQLNLGEDSEWEFKRVEFRNAIPYSPKRGDLADEIVAFANAEGGVLLLSVTDSGEVLDMSREQIASLRDLLTELSTDSIEPSVRILTYNRILHDGKKLLVVEVPKGDSLHSRGGESYIRVGGSKRKMTSDERMRLAQRRGQARFRWFDEQIVPDTGFGTLDESLWKPLLSSEGAANPELALTKLSLLAPDEDGILRCTVAGVLLCAMNHEEWFPGARVTATLYRGRDRASGQLDSQEITGPLDRQIKEAVTFAVRNMRVMARKEPGRVELPQYSKKALFEAMVNAVAHRDYSIHKSATRLSMFEDRLEIQSPGLLANNMTLDNMTERQATRNEVLTSALGRMSAEGIHGSEDRQYFMERRGDGVSIIHRETMELCGKPARYDIIDESDIRLTIPAAPQELTPARAVITACRGGELLADVDVLAVFPNKTWKRSRTDERGEAVMDLHSTHLPMTVFAAAEGFSARIERGWVPRERDLVLDMEPLAGGGAVIFAEDSGQVPGLDGRVNPVRDSLGRTYVYAFNISINDGQPQPVNFSPGENLTLADSGGNEKTVRIMEIVGRASLVEYRKLPGKDSL